MNSSTSGSSVTLQGIADQLGLSRSGVSRALRGHPSISTATQDLVRQTAERMGYRPNPYVSALMTHLKSRRALPQQEVLALVIFQANRTELFNFPFTKRLVAGLEERAAELGYRIEDFFVGPRGMSLRRMETVLYHRNIRGIIFAPTPQHRGHASLTFDRYAMITAGYSLWRPDISRVTANYEHVVATTLRELRRLGYRRIGLAVHKSNDDRVDRRWSGGFLSHSRIPEDCEAAPLLITTDWNASGLVRWVRKQRLDAVISPHIEALHWIKSAGLSVPGDIGFAVLDWNETFQDLCAGFDQCSNLIGRFVASQLITQIERNETGLPQSPLTTSVKGQWHSGPSIARRSGFESKRRAGGRTAARRT
ncbi:MAG: LacI family DNA-binding transcriptional regulator [Terrimicrobiaceae bacterium]|nr:LacI family DNA-binding transcriptional regulator [Terrimicrobiaceae bacterium]